MFENSAAFTYPNFLGVSLQQDPNDAFAIMDLLWRLKPDLLIELGTNGGGSAFFYAVIMRSYNPKAKIITIDPMRTKDWNLQQVLKICPHCINARDTTLWKDTDAITFINKMPIDSISEIKSMIAEWGSQRVVVMDDSNHHTKVVSENLLNFSPFVSPGSYFIVQDTKMRRLAHMKLVDPRKSVDRFLLSDEGKYFEVDRTFEYYHCTQHSHGFLRRKETNAL
jgi:cephalosporin hydroxylase